MSAVAHRIAAAEQLAHWLAEHGHHRQAQTVRGIRASLSRFQVANREIARLRSKMTPITQARIREARKPLDDELRTTAALLERMAKIADTEGPGPVGVEPPDATYLADLLRRASEA